MILQRILKLIPILLAITMVAFVFIRLLPGDPIEVMMGEKTLPPAKHAEYMHDLGLDLPIYVQYIHYIEKILQGDLGNSLASKRPVLSEFLTLFPATIELTILAVLMAVIIGIPLGVIAAIKRGSWLDHSLIGVSLTGYSMPIFWWGLICIMIFAGWLGITPVSGRISLIYYFEPITGFMILDALLYGEYQGALSALHHILLPAFVLGTHPLAVIARQTRSAMLEVLNEDYIRTARAKGLPESRVIFVHGLRNALIPIITTMGLQVGALLGGAILTETIFSWPGIGKWMVEAIFHRDYPTVQSGLLLIAVIIMAVNLLVDMAYAVANPKLRGLT